jgi:hypothetical protein
MIHLPLMSTAAAWTAVIAAQAIGSSQYFAMPGLMIYAPL